MKMRMGFASYYVLTKCFVFEKKGISGTFPPCIKIFAYLVYWMLFKHTYYCVTLNNCQNVSIFKVISGSSCLFSEFLKLHIVIEIIGDNISSFVD